MSVAFLFGRRKRSANGRKSNFYSSSFCYRPFHCVWCCKSSAGHLNRLSHRFFSRWFRERITLGHVIWFPVLSVCQCVSSTSMPNPLHPSIHPCQPSNRPCVVQLCDEVLLLFFLYDSPTAVQSIPSSYVGTCYVFWSRQDGVCWTVFGIQK